MRNLKKINFRTFFSDSEVQELGFSRICGRARNHRKNRKSVRRGWVSWGNHPKPFFRVQEVSAVNMSHILVRPFSKKLCFCEVRAFLADFPEIAFWSIYGYVISYIFREIIFSSKYLLGNVYQVYMHGKFWFFDLNKFYNTLKFLKKS